MAEGSAVGFVKNVKAEITCDKTEVLSIGEMGVCGALIK